MRGTERQVKLALPDFSDISLTIHGSIDRVISERIFKDGYWEPFETSILISSLREGYSFLDVGANIGYFTILAARLVGPSGSVYSFEPEPVNFRLMSKSLSQNKLSNQVKAMRIALSNRDSEEKLYLSADNYGDHQLYPDKKDKKSILVTLRHGSRLLLNDITRLHFIKVDTQGSEYEVLDGLMPMLLSLTSLPRMLIELTPYSLRTASSSGEALINLIRELGAKLWIVDHVNHELVATTADHLCTWCNNVDATPGDRGFINIFVGESPF